MHAIPFSVGLCERPTWRSPRFLFVWFRPLVIYAKTRLSYRIVDLPKQSLFGGNYANFCKVKGNGTANQLTVSRRAMTDCEAGIYKERIFVENFTLSRQKAGIVGYMKHSPWIVIDRYHSPIALKRNLVSKGLQLSSTSAGNNNTVLVKMKQTPCYSALQKTADTLPSNSVGSKLQQIFQSKKSKSTMDVSSVIETAFLFQGYHDAESCSSCSDNSSEKCSDSSLDLTRFDACHKQSQLHHHSYRSPDLPDDLLDEAQCSSVSTLLREHLLHVQSSCLHCNLMVPHNLISRIAEDVVRMSHCEPCGLRGCVIFITVQRETLCHRVGKIECDPDTVATFELHLTLKEDTKHWFNLRDLIFMLLSGCSPGSLRDDIYVSPGFQLVKKKLYRPN